MNRLLILSNFIDKKRKTIGKLVNGHIKRDISFIWKMDDKNFPNTTVPYCSCKNSWFGILTRGFCKESEPWITKTHVK